MLDCDGLAPVNVEISATPEFLAQGDAVLLTVAWDVGTDINFRIDFGDGVHAYDWNWQVRSTCNVQSCTCTMTYVVYTGITISKN